MTETQPANRPLNGLLRAVFASPLYAASLGGGARSPIAAAFEDPWPGGVEAADRLFQGRYAFAGEEHRRVGAPPWDVADASPAWIAEINSFNWLRDFRAQGGETARRAARELLRGWLARYPAWDQMAWRPDVLGRRIAAWLCHARFLLEDADDDFHAAFLDHLARQARHLHRAARLGPDGVGRLAAAAGLCLAGVALTGATSWRERGLEYLGAETERQILRDGGHISRDPSALLEVFGELVRVRAALRASRSDVPIWLQNALDRMAPALRFFRHGDGGVALFNGAHEEAAEVIDALIAAADAQGRAPASLPDSGFARVSAHRVTLVVDGGAPPPPPFDEGAHAGPSSFEMSVGRDRLIVNCGRGHDPSWRQASRMTAAHSTLAIGETNAFGVDQSGGVGRRPDATTLESASTAEGHWIETSHDGYRAPYGIDCRRRLYLAPTGDSLSGEDTLSGGPGGQTFGVRFHLHPEVRVSRVQDGRGALLHLSRGGWRFAAEDAAVGLEESVYLGAAGLVRRTHQLVIAGVHGGDQTVVRWRLSRADA